MTESSLVPSAVPSPWGGRGFFVARTGSTMADALDLEAQGYVPGSFVMAGEQTAGRGRLAGRRWVSQPGDSLSFTFYLSPEQLGCRTLAPSLVFGWGVCLWVESLGLKPRLKWPNDVLLPVADDPAGADKGAEAPGMGKLCGILVTARWSAGSPASFHCGIGINLRRQPPQSFSRPAVSLEDLGVNLSPEPALTGLFPFLARAAAEENPRPFVEERLWHRGEYHEVDTPEGAVGGVLRGLDSEGALVLETSQGLKTVTAGE